MSLRTLKDLKQFDFNKGYPLPVEICFLEKDLKDIAIEWIKEISKDGFRKIPEVKVINGKFDTSEVAKVIITQETDLVVRWIKHFFNIEEKDLE